MTNRYPINSPRGIKQTYQAQLRNQNLDIGVSLKNVEDIVSDLKIKEAKKFSIPWFQIKASHNASGMSSVASTREAGELTLVSKPHFRKGELASSQVNILEQPTSFRKHKCSRMDSYVPNDYSVKKDKSYEKPEEATHIL